MHMCLIYTKMLYMCNFLLPKSCSHGEGLLCTMARGYCVPWHEWALLFSGHSHRGFDVQEMWCCCIRTIFVDSGQRLKEEGLFFLWIYSGKTCEQIGG